MVLLYKKFCGFCGSLHMSFFMGSHFLLPSRLRPRARLKAIKANGSLSIMVSSSFKGFLEVKKLHKVWASPNLMLLSCCQQKLTPRSTILQLCYDSCVFTKFLTGFRAQQNNSFGVKKESVNRAKKFGKTQWQVRKLQRFVICY